MSTMTCEGCAAARTDVALYDARYASGDVVYGFRLCADCMSDEWMRREAGIAVLLPRVRPPMKCRGRRVLGKTAA